MYTYTQLSGYKVQVEASSIHLSDMACIQVSEVHNFEFRHGDTEKRTSVCRIVQSTPST